MRNIILISSIYLIAISAAHASGQEYCINAAEKAIFESQVKELNLNPVEKANFAVEWYGQMIEDDPQFLRTREQIEILCRRAYVMAVPI